MKKQFLVVIILFFSTTIHAQRTTILLNGQWEFDQTENAFPPNRFTRKIPVPGLIHLATPRVKQYDLFF